MVTRRRPPQGTRSAVGEPQAVLYRGAVFLPTDRHADRRPARGSAVDVAEPLIRELLQTTPSMPATVIGERIGWDREITTLRTRCGSCGSCLCAGPGILGAVLPADDRLSEGARVEGLPRLFRLGEGKPRATAHPAQDRGCRVHPPRLEPGSDDPAHPRRTNPAHVPITSALPPASESR